MYFAKKWSITLVGSFGIGMLVLLLCLLGNSPVQAAAAQPIGTWHFVNNLIGGAHGQSDATGRVSGQAFLQLAATLYQLEFAQVEEVLRDANQNPVGVRLNGRGYTAEGRAFNFTYIAQRTPDGQCCAVEIWAPEIHASGRIRFEAVGELRFE